MLFEFKDKEQKMKKFMKIFLATIALLFTYIFITSINQIYEKNHIVDRKMTSYIVVDNDVNSMGDLYDELTSKYPKNKLQIIKNTISGTYNSVYEFYCFPLDQTRKRQPATLSIHYKYIELTKDDFTDSSGVFYTNISKDEIDKIASSLNIEINPISPEKIEYSVFFKLCLIDFAILFASIQIVFCVYTSYNLKKIGVKKSMGFSSFTILKEQLREILLSYFCISGSIYVCLLMFYLFTNRLTLFLVLLLLLYYIVIACVITVLMLNTSFILNMISLEEMIKNKTVNTTMNIIAQSTKILFMLLISLSIIKVANAATEYKKSQEDILNYKYLENYYTSDGFLSEMYDKVYQNKDNLCTYAGRMEQMYNNENALLCDTNKIELRKSTIQSEPEYVTNTIIVNAKYLNEFSNINTNKDYDTSEQYTVYVSEKYKNNSNEIQKFIDSCLFTMSNSTAIEFRISDQSTLAPKSSIEYVESNKIIKYLTDDGFQDQEVGIIIVDNGHSDGAYYLNCLNAGYIFYKLNSRDEFTFLLNKYNLNNLVSSGTLLTPYLTEYENVQFKLKTYSIFSIVFLISLTFIIYISGYVDIMVNKSRYALKETLGYNHFNILKKIYFLICIEFIITIFLLKFVDFSFVFMILAVIADLIIYEILYRIFINKKIYEIVKGA